MIQGVANATVRNMDLWSISMESGLPDRQQSNSLQAAHPTQQNGHQEDEGSKRRHDISLKEQGPFIDDELPAAISRQDSNQQQGSKRQGNFTYYLTVGLDAEAAYRSACLCCNPSMLSAGIHTESIMPQHQNHAFVTLTSESHVTLVSSSSTLWRVAD